MTIRPKSGVAKISVPNSATHRRCKYRRYASRKGACTHTGFLPESDPAPVVEFFTRTGITAAGGGFHTD